MLYPLLSVGLTNAHNEKYDSYNQKNIKYTVLLATNTMINFIAQK